MIEIDGSIYPVSNGIIRTACSLSAATKKPCRIFNIDKMESKPEITVQSLLEIQTLARFSNGRLENDFPGSKEIKFFPGQADENPSSINIKIENNQSIVSTLQVLIPTALFFSKPIKINLNGGITDAFFSSTIDYFRYVFLKILEKMEAKIEINIIRKGYYPEGKAKIEITIYPSKLKPLDLMERGLLRKILIVSGASENLKDKKTAERQLMGTREILGKLNLPIEEKVEYYDTDCPGSQICLIAEFENTIIGSDSLAKMGKRAEDLGKEAAFNLLKEEKSEACLDKHSINQILPYLALIKEKSSITVSEITEQTKIDIKIIEKFLKGNFKIKNNSIIWISK